MHIDGKGCAAAKKRLLMVENSGRFVGGGQVSFLQLAERLDRSRFEPYVVCPNEGDFMEAVLERGIPALVQTMPRLKGWGVLAAPLALRAFTRLIEAYGIDLIHANGTRAMIYSGLAGQWTARPVVWHVRVLGSDGPLDRLLSSLAARVVVNSRAVAQRFPFIEDRARGPVVVHNGVPVDVFAEARLDPQLRSAWQLDSKFVLLVLAQLIPRKRQDVAIEALTLLRAEGIDAVLVLVGDEDLSSKGYRAVLQALATDRDVAAQCIFAGFRRDVPALLKLSDLLLHPARDEPFGRAIIEAMAAGVPVVASSGGGVDEIIRHDVTGVLVRSSDPRDWAEAIRQLYESEPRRRRLSESARASVQEHFSLESHVNRMEELYREVLTP